jgi:hypothetical protein
MEIQNRDKFIRNVEHLIRPMKVSNLLFFQNLKGLLPPLLLRRLLYRASRNTPHIGFVIEPYSLFLFFRLRDLDKARSMLPDRYELAETKLFADDEPAYYMGYGNLGTRASTFWGTRTEAYLIATDRETGLLSFIFIDILSNTIIALPEKGIADPNCSRALFTTSPGGQIYLDIEEDRSGRRLALTGSIKRGNMRPLYERLWLMGNTSIGHSRDLAKGDDRPFAVIFDPAEVEEALEIPPEDIRIEENTLFPGLAEPEISTVICFPFAQHYMADSPGIYTTVRDEEELVGKYNELAGSGGFKTFSAGTIVRQVTLLVAVLIVIAAALVLLL